MGETSSDSFLFLLALIDVTITHLATSQITFDQAALCCQFLRPCQSLNNLKGVGVDVVMGCAHFHTIAMYK